MMKVFKIAVFMRVRGLSHGQFDNLLSDDGDIHGLPYHTEL